jgi:hypothetical protein
MTPDHTPPIYKMFFEILEQIVVSVKRITRSPDEPANIELAAFHHLVSLRSVLPNFPDYYPILRNSTSDDLQQHPGKLTRVQVRNYYTIQNADLF